MTAFDDSWRKCLPLVLLLASSCTNTVSTVGNGSSAGTGAPGVNGGSSENTTATGAGHAIFSGADETYIVDLATLNAESITMTDLWPTRDGSAWATYTTERRYSDDEDDIAIYDASWSRQKTIPIRKSLHSMVQLSPDKKRIAVQWADESAGESYTEPTLTVFDLETNILARLPKAVSCDWLPDGRLVYSEPGAIFVGDTKGFNGKRIATVDGTPQDLAANQDGSRLAFSMGASMDERHVWTVNIDGSELAQLTQSGHNEMDPVWTGDGRLLLRHYVSVSSTGYNTCPDLFLVASSSAAPFDPSKSDKAQQLQYKKPKADYLVNACPFSAVAWTP